jgi:hypothetical protein
VRQRIQSHVNKSSTSFFRSVSILKSHPCFHFHFSWTFHFSRIIISQKFLFSSCPAFLTVPSS